MDGENKKYLFQNTGKRIKKNLIGSVLVLLIGIKFHFLSCCDAVKKRMTNAC